MAVKWVLLNPQTGDPFEPVQIQWDVASSVSAATYFASGWSGLKSFALLLTVYFNLIENPGVTGLIVLPTDRLLREFMGNLFRPAFKKIIKSETRREDSFFFHGDRRIVALSGHVPERIEAYTAGWAIVDEAGLCDKSVLLRLTARCRDPRAKLRRITLAGVPRHGWLRSEFENKNNSKRRIIHARTTDNPFLTQDYISNLESACPARQRKAYLDGQFVTPGGEVYPEFSSKHIIDWVPSHYITNIEGNRYRSCIGAVIDWSPRHPKVLFIQSVPDSVYIPYKNGIVTTKSVGIVVDELEPDGIKDPISVEKLCQLIKAKNYNLDWILADPAGKAKEQTSTRSAMDIAQVIMDMPIDTPPRRLRGIQAGIDHVRLALEPASGHPRLFFSKRLRRNTHERGMLNSIRTYAYPQAKDGEPLSDKPIEDGIAEDACFVGSTMIKTKDGDIPIKKIRPGMEVLTRLGYRKVIAAGKTGRTYVHSYAIGGRKIKCTPGHRFKIWTEDGIQKIGIWRMYEKGEGTFYILNFENKPRMKTVEVKMIKGYPVTHDDILGIENVYNLTVEDQHEYFANGVLAANCDCLRYYTVWKFPAERLTWQHIPGDRP